MALAIGKLPAHLQSVALKLDGNAGVSANKSVENAEVSAALRDVTRFSASERAQLRELQALLDTAGPAMSSASDVTGGVTRKMGPGAAWESTVYPARDGQQREVISFGPGGLKLAAGSQVEIQPQLGGGITGVRVGMDATLRGFATATVGGKVPGQTGDQPLRGAVTLQASSTITVKTLEILSRSPALTAAEFQDYAQQQRAAHPAQALLGVDTTTKGIAAEASGLFKTFWDNSGVEAMQGKLDDLLGRFAPHLNASQYLEVFKAAFKELDLGYIEQMAGSGWNDKVDALHATFGKHSRSISSQGLAPGALEKAHTSLNGGVDWGSDGTWWKPS